jgi:cytosine/adenosine deaminase-related metal-dependent hydrolase
MILEGKILAGDEMDLIEGYLVIKDGHIKEVTELPQAANSGIMICPAMVNAHTHLGDSIIKDPPHMPLSDLVGPGGLKHRALANCKRDLIVEAMRESIRQMLQTGTASFADFREGGIDGVSMLLEAVSGLPISSRILGRPLDLTKGCGGGDLSLEIHEACWGIGISSTRDHQMPFLEELAFNARRAGKKIAIHAGEAGRDDINSALSLQPDIVVHLAKATREDMLAVAKSGASAVVCPRSNLMTGSGMPDPKKMIEEGITVAVGTDNVMLNSPDMLSEMHLIDLALVHDDRQVFKMCTLYGAKVLGQDERIGSIRTGKEARLMVIDLRSGNMLGSMNPIASLVRRAEQRDILAVF